MEKSKVYFTDFRTRLGEGLPSKLKRLMKAAGIQNIDMDHKFVAIKLHFGELGNLGFLRPNYAKAVADVVKELGGVPFLTDCNTLYPGNRKNAIEHMYCAWENGFTPLTVGCPVIIGDGLKGTDDIEVPVKGGEYVKNAKIGRAIMDADVFISLNHFKGHETVGIISKDMKRWALAVLLKISVWAAVPERAKWSSMRRASRRSMRVCAGAVSAA